MTEIATFLFKYNKIMAIIILSCYNYPLKEITKPLPDIQ